MGTSVSMAEPLGVAQPTFFVNISVEQRGSASPPLFDGYRNLFANITTITLDGKHKRRVTDRIRNCAARILCFLNYQLARSQHPGEGVRYSRTDFQILFRYEYGLDIIEIAQSLLISQGYVLSPVQTRSVDRAFCWRLDGHRLQQAFEQMTRNLEEHKQSAPHRKPTHLVLVNHSTEIDNSLTQTQQENEDAESDNDADTGKSGPGKEEVSHDPISRPGQSEISASMQTFHPVQTAKTEHANAKIRACSCNRNTRESKNKQKHQKDSSFPPHQHNGRKEKDSTSLNHQTNGVYQATSHPAYPPPDAPASPELILALFDWLRGYLLPDKLLARAKDAARLLIDGDEHSRQPYSRFQIEQTALYLRDHDPAWQANYAKWCATTGIPDIWSVAAVIARKWPIVVRHLLASGAYVQLDDGTLLAQEDYQAWLQQEQETWQRQQQEFDEDRFLSNNEENNEERSLPTSEQMPGTPTDADENEVYVPAPTTNSASPDPDIIGWTRPGVARLHADRLARALPAYFNVEVQPLSEGVYGILITNSCIQDDSMLITSNQQVCDLLAAIREERACEDQGIGWSILAIAQWWADRLAQMLPAVFQIEICTVDEERYGVKITNSSQQTSAVLRSNLQVEAVLTQYMSKRSTDKRAFSP
jgi:hypothetical protein